MAIVYFYHHHIVIEIELFFVHENCCNQSLIAVECVPKCQINNKPAFV